jgi:hypothetical protein
MYNSYAIMYVLSQERTINMTTIYYKNNKLDKYRTFKSVSAYYIKSWVRGERPVKPVIASSLRQLDTF